MSIEFKRELHQLVQFSENIWTDEEKAILKNLRHRFEGPGEQAYRQRFGITSKPNNKSIDIPEHGAELKYCDGSSFAKIGLGAYAYRKMIQAIHDVIFEKRFIEEDARFRTLLDCLSPHENNFDALDDHLTPDEAIMFQYKLRMSECLQPDVQKLVLITDVGFLSIPRIECNDAFTFEKSSFGKLKYKLNRSYVQTQLLAAIPQDVPSLLGVEEPRHELSKSSEIVAEQCFSTIGA